MNDLQFCIHDLYRVTVKNAPKGVFNFLIREFGYYGINQKNDRLTSNLEVQFIDKRLTMPKEYVSFTDDISYAGGNFYISRGNAKLLFPVRDIDKNNLVIISEKGMDKWIIFYAIEKMILLKMLEKGFCFFHASGFTENGEATIYASSQGIGKTYLVLKAIERGAQFLGDDLVLVTQSLDAYPYARGINVHPFHRDIFRKAIRRIPFKESFVNFMTRFLLNVLNFFVSLPSKHKNRLGNYIKFKSTVRLAINELLPHAKISERAQIKNFFLLLKSECKNSPFAKNFTTRQISLILLNDIRKEREKFIEDAYRIFLTHGDVHSMSIRKYLSRLFSKEARMFNRVLRKAKPSVLEI